MPDRDASGRRGVRPARGRARAGRRQKVLRPRSIRGIRPYSLEEAYGLLAAYYGVVDHRPRLPPLDELVWTILSQHTSDLNAGRAYDSLRAALPTWDEVLAAPVREVADAIRHGGLADQKAPRIQEVLATVKERTGGFDIAFLAEMPIDEAKEWLRSLPGVGPKTAAVVLSFSLGRPVFAVDTHIYRVAGRLGLIGPKVGVNEAHDVLEASIEPERVFPAHVYLITHGRRICKAQRPLCGACVLVERCPARPHLEQRKLTGIAPDDLRPALAPKPL